MANKSKTVAIGCGIAIAVCLGIVITLVFALGIALETGIVPDTEAQPSGKIPARQLRQLQELGVTEAGETVLFFYSAGLLHVREDGNLFTDRRVISYEETEDGSLDISSAAYDEIEGIEFTPSESWLEDSTIIVTKSDGDLFVLIVSSESKGDVKFFQKLMEEWEKHKRNQEAAGGQRPMP